MPVLTLSIDQFRNLAPVTLHFSSRLNLFIGANAAGKTSILEALFILGRARSFRTRYLDKAIQTGSDRFQVVATVSPNGGRVIPVGISRAEKQLMARIDAQAVKRLSDLAALFPIQWVGGDLHRLLEDGPAFRRQYLDWGLFHVKQSYIPAWKRFQKLLKQRNASLRTARTLAEIAVWDGELANEGAALHRFRQAYIQELETVFQRVAAELLVLSAPFEIRYRPGWSADQSYAESLQAGLERDREQGFTRTGPQRADLVFCTGGQPVTEQLSRGQQKLLVVALHVAQAKVLKHNTGTSSLFLLDDLGAELDSVNQAKIMNLLVDIDAQVFATAIELPDMSTWNRAETKTFHVKHGVVSEVL
jgi:DNA replication and repair protein RecF